MNSGKPLAFEAGIYNKDVIEEMKNGQRHRHLKDDWAEVHYIKTLAYTLEDARRKLAAKYPPEQGYVIDAVYPLTEE